MCTNFHVIKKPPIFISYIYKHEMEEEKVCDGWFWQLLCTSLKTVSPLLERLVWEFNLWGNPGTFRVALGHGEHQNWGVENSILPKQLQFTAGPADGMAAGGVEGK